MNVQCPVATNIRTRTPSFSLPTDLLVNLTVGYHVIIFQKGAILCSEPARY